MPPHTLTVRIDYDFPVQKGVSAVAALTGGAAVPPKYAFGFLACRWGWENRSYIEATLDRFRDGNFPLDVRSEAILSGVFDCVHMHVWCR